MALRTLALCAGIGGLDLGVRLARPDHRLVGAVERQAYCAAVLVARMADSSLDEAPIWDDISTFDGRAWRGAVDLVTAGYPCQPFSVAGERGGLSDPRHLWPHVWRVTQESEAGLLFCENVPGHLSLGLGAVLADLSSRGWIAEWDCVPAAAVGAPHLRDRLFLLAADPDRIGQQGERGCGLPDGERKAQRDDIDGRAGAPADSDGPRHEGSDASRARRRPIAAECAWRGRSDAPEPVFRRVDARTPHRMDVDWADRIHALGNAVVPQAAAQAWAVLWERLHGA